MITEGAVGNDSDLALALSCSEGQAAACESFERQYSDILRNVLVGRGATATEAEDLTRSILSDCVMGQPGRQPLLQLYHGRCSLKSWLITCATNRLIDLKRMGKFRGSLPTREDEPSHDPFDALAAPTPRQSEPALTQLLRDALEDALAACSAEDRLALRVVYLEGVTQREVARMWGCHESKISRMLEEAMRQIAERTMNHITEKDPWLSLTWDDFLEMCDASRTSLPL